MISLGKGFRAVVLNMLHIKMMQEFKRKYPCYHLSNGGQECKAGLVRGRLLIRRGR
jgi:hypothetical protein